MIGERRDPCPIRERQSAPRCGSGPLARWRFIVGELRAWMRRRKPT